MKSISKDILSILTIILVAVLSLKGFSERIDINLTDDTGYMILGILIRENILVGFGPLYSIMFKVIKIFTDDTVVIYDTAMHLMYILPPLAAYAMMRAMSLKPFTALLLSVGFLWSPNIMSFITWSKISHYTILMVMLWVIWTRRLKTTFDLLISLSVFTFLLGFIRPESHLSWYISIVVLWLFWWKGLQADKQYLKRMLPISLLFGLYLFLTLASGIDIISKINLLVNPMAGGRSNIAFAQQFSYNYCEWNGLNNFDWIQWRDFSKENFGDFNTLGEAFKNNPSTFIQHIFYNIQQYIIKFTYGVQSIFLPPAIFKWNSWISTLLLIVILTATLWVSGISYWWDRFKTLFIQHIYTILALVVISIPSVVSSIIFYTREHYLLLVMPLVLYLLALFFIAAQKTIDNQARIFKTISFLGLIALIFIIHPTLSDYKTYDVWEEYDYPSNRKTIEAIRQMNFTQDIRQIDHEGGLAAYAGKNFKWINLISKTESSYQEYEKEEQPNFYYVTQALLSNRFLTEDDYFMDIIHHPEKHNLHVIQLQEENKGYLLVHDSLQYTPIQF